MDTERYARIVLNNHHPDITLEQWKGIAEENPNIEVKEYVKNTFYQVYGYINEEEYFKQMWRADDLWVEPTTGLTGEFDDIYYEQNTGQ